jgi:hypothetical protein
VLLPCGGLIQRPTRTRRLSSSPTPPTTDDLSSPSSSEGYGAASSEPPAAAPSGSTPHASQFASMTHSKEWGRDDDPASIVGEQQGTVAIRPTAESFRPDTAEDDAVDGPDVDPSSYAPRPVVGGDNTNWANTALDRPPPAASLTYEPTPPMPTFMPTSSPVRITNFAEAFREPSSSSASHAGGGGHGENAFVDETDVSTVDDLMMREADGTSPHLTESYATASYVANVEDGPRTSSPKDDVPISRSSPSTNGDVDESEPSGTVCPKDSLRCPDGSFVSREIDDGCNFASCPDRAHPNAGHFFPVWGFRGNIVCVNDASPPGWALGAYLKETKETCCKAYSMLRVSECLSA